MANGDGVNLTDAEIDRRAAAVRIILVPYVDGVLTDGRVIINGDGSESKSFFIRDGIAMVWAQRAGIKVGFLLGLALAHDAAPRRPARDYAGLPRRVQQAGHVRTNPGWSRPH